MLGWVVTIPRYAFSKFRKGEIPNLGLFLEFSASTARLLDSFSEPVFHTSFLIPCSFSSLVAVPLPPPDCLLLPNSCPSTTEATEAASTWEPHFQETLALLDF